LTFNPRPNDYNEPFLTVFVERDSPVVNLDTIEAILARLDGYQAKLAILANYSREEFLQDFTKVESAKHLLQVSIECCLDIAHHIVADEGYRTAQDYYDTFVILNEEGILPDEYMSTLRKIVSFRNRLVHLYWDVDDDTIYGILQQNLPDFRIYVNYILNFLQGQSKTE
jgi:uncharacterized protein YutE (UPF0331/DUF86 family)